MLLSNNFKFMFKYISKATYYSVIIARMSPTDIATNWNILYVINQWSMYFFSWGYFWTQFVANKIVH